MSKTIEQLLDVRHAAYVRARMGDFKTEADTKAWREANRIYVLARMSKQTVLLSLPDAAEAA
jgi:hypothetical protein